MAGPMTGSSPPCRPALVLVRTHESVARTRWRRSRAMVSLAAHSRATIIRAVLISLTQSGELRFVLSLECRTVRPGSETRESRVHDLECKIQNLIPARLPVGWRRSFARVITTMFRSVEP